MNLRYVRLQRNLRKFVIRDFSSTERRRLSTLALVRKAIRSPLLGTLLWPTFLRIPFIWEEIDGRDCGWGSGSVSKGCERDITPLLEQNWFKTWKKESSERVNVNRLNPLRQELRIPFCDHQKERNIAKKGCRSSLRITKRTEYHTKRPESSSRTSEST